MKAIIDSNEFNDVTWSVDNSIGTLSLPITNSINSILNICNVASEILIYGNNNEFIGRWHIFNFIAVQTSETYDVQFQIGLNGVTSNATIEELESAIMELGSMMNSYRDQLKLYKQQLEEVNNQMRARENQFNIRVNEQQNIVGVLDNKISNMHPTLVELQSRINSLPLNVNNRIAELENKCNKMADRITMVERRT